MPDLGAIKFLWYICHDVNVVVECWEHVEKMYSEWSFTDNPNAWRAWRLMMKNKKWIKSQRIAFCRDLASQTRIGLTDWNDVHSMLSQCYEAFGKDMELPRGSSLKAIHDELSILVRKASIEER